MNKVYSLGLETDYREKVEIGVTRTNGEQLANLSFFAKLK